MTKRTFSIAKTIFFASEKMFSTAKKIFSMTKTIVSASEKIFSTAQTMV